MEPIARRKRDDETNPLEGDELHPERSPMTMADVRKGLAG